MTFEMIFYFVKVLKIVYSAIRFSDIFGRQKNCH